VGLALGAVEAWAVEVGAAMEVDLVVEEGTEPDFYTLPYLHSQGTECHNTRGVHK